MSTTIENQTATKARTDSTTTVKRPRTTRRAPDVRPASPDQTTEVLVKRPTSELTRLVFVALLGCAACIALVGVVSEASNTPATSPDDPPPAVITELAD